MKITKKYNIEKLTCPECAEHVVERLEQLYYIDEVYIDYDKKEISIVGNEELNDDQINQIIDFVTIEEHHEKHNLNKIQGLVTEEFCFDDIDCANCAAKVERELNKNKEIIDARVNFITKKIIIKHMGKLQIFNVVSKIVNSIESQAVVYQNKEDKNVHEHEHSERTKINIILTIIGIIVFVLSFIFQKTNESNIYSRIGYIISYFLISYDILLASIKGFIHKDFFNESILMVVASLGALAINENIESIAVILLYKIGEYFQDKSTEKSRNAIKSLMEVKVDTVHLQDGSVKNVSDVEIGETITIKVGEKIPLDGVVKKGSTELDMKALTGESIPIFTSEGNEILSGSINLAKVIDVQVTKKESDSTISKVLKLVEEASNQKSKSEQFITKFARIYTPIVLLIALIVGLVQFFVIDMNLKDSLNNVFTILVISCPCALVISIPLGYFAGIGRSSASGVLVKGSNYLEALTNAKTFVFDKTGTITKGNFKVCGVYPISGVSEEELLGIVAEAEQYSLHPIATSIQEAYGKTVSTLDNSSIEEISGAGLMVKTNKDIILVGNDKLMKQYNITYNKNDDIGTILYVAKNNCYIGSISIRDEIKEEASALITSLNNNNYNTIMLTGDSPEVAEDIAKKINLSEVKSKLLPNEKYDVLKEIIKNNTGSVVYVGDGINDTPSLKLADVGLAMGGIGSDSAKECADIVIMKDNLLKITEVIQIAKYTKIIVIENIVFALFVKLLALVIGVFGLLDSLGMLAAIFADVGVCLIAILNAMRILKYKERKK